MRRTESGLSFPEPTPRELKKVGAGRPCSTHRLGATCDYVKKQLVLIVRPLCVGRGPG